ncbi:MAG: HlyC/CorC family transporter [Candidatus Krumholzibacteriota bacterium]|nr:HlyC/CorC family transporter [Candidatus Krumholzibacteriota bacterium]
MTGAMESVPIAIPLLLVAQFLLSCGAAAFSAVSRMHEDKVFPLSRVSRAARLLHRSRLHLLIGLALLQGVVVFAAAAAAGALPGAGAAGRMPAYAIVFALLVAATILGGGLADRRPARFATLLSWPLLPVYTLLRPLTGLFLRTATALFPDLVRELASPFFVFADRREPGEGFIEEEGSRLMHRIAAFSDKRVREVMVPRIDVFAVDLRAPLDEVRREVAEAGHSRVPVYDDQVDRIVGILHVKDFARPGSGETGGLSALLREPFFVPEGKKIDELLREFQLERKHMAVVVDEYGGTAGIVTIEDIIEEIVGEIEDEYDEETPLVFESSPGEYVAQGRMNIGEFNEAVHLSIRTEEADTLAGFLYTLMGRVPVEGEEIVHDGVVFRISRLEGQRIAEVTVRLPGAGE